MRSMRIPMESEGNMSCNARSAKDIRCHNAHKMLMTLFQMAVLHSLLTKQMAVLHDLLTKASKDIRCDNAHKMLVTFFQMAVLHDLAVVSPKALQLGPASQASPYVCLLPHVFLQASF